jgi:uncharacterized membrane protein YgaE (UPF0421/DUF939 family)
MPPEANQESAVGLGLRVGCASSSCLIISEWFHLEQAALSVYTAHLIMALFPVTSFQKGVERFFGRTIGILYGLVLVIYLRDAPLLYLGLIAVGQIAACYVYLSGRLAYAALMAAIFVGVMGSMGLSTPSGAPSFAWYSILQLLLGEWMAFAVNFATGAERTLAIEVKGEALFPLRANRLNTAAMLSAGQIGTMMATLLLDLPVTPTMISALIIGITPGNELARWMKAWQRILGALLGGGYALAVIVLLAYMPYFPLLVALVFFGMYAASYLTRASDSYSYAFLQMGMVVPMTLIDAQGDIGSISKAVQRVIGVAVGLLVAGLVNIAWPHADIAVAPAASPAVQESHRS